VTKAMYKSCNVHCTASVFRRVNNCCCTARATVGRHTRVQHAQQLGGTHVYSTHNSLLAHTCTACAAVGRHTRVQHAQQLAAHTCTACATVVRHTRVQHAQQLGGTQVYSTRNSWAAHTCTARATVGRHTRVQHAQLFGGTHVYSNIWAHTCTTRIVHTCVQQQLCTHVYSNCTHTHTHTHTDWCNKRCARRPVYALHRPRQDIALCFCHSDHMQ